MALIKVTFPSHLCYFYKLIFKLSELDPLHCAQIYEAIFIFKETGPLNMNFEQYGIENMIFISNSGSLLVLAVIIIGTYFNKRFFNWVAKKCYRKRRCRKIGIWASNNNAILVPF